MGPSDNDDVGRPTPTPARPTPVRALSAVESLSKLGIATDDDGTLHVPKSALQQIRDDRIRASALTQVPNAPRLIYRTGGGEGVQKGFARWDQLTLESLRTIRERAPIVQAIHRARDQQVRRISREWTGRRGDVGWRVVHKDHNASDADPPDSIKPAIETFRRMLKKPSEDYCPTTGDLLGGLEEDLLTINRPTVEILHSVFDRDYAVGFRPVDGGIIWPTLRWLEKWMAEHPRWWAPYNPQDLNEESALGLISDVVGHDITTAEFCLVREGMLEAVYRPGSILCAPLLNRTDIRYVGYPPSHVEQAVEVILNFLNTWEFNGAYFTRGMLAEFILGISGNVHDDDIDAFADLLRQASQGARRAWQPPIMPLPDGQKIEKIDLKPTNRDMMFEVWMSLLIAICTAVYRMDPSTINAKPWDGGSSPQMGAPNREKEIALAKEEGLQGDVQHLIDHVLNPLAQKVHPDLQVIFEWGDFDPLKEAQIANIRSRISITRNEVRLAEGMEPLGFWLSPEEYAAATPEMQKAHDESMWNMPADPTFVNAMNQRAAMAAQLAAGQPDGFGGAKGQPDGFGGEQPQFAAPTPQDPTQQPSQGDQPGMEPGSDSPGAAGDALAKGRRVTIRVYDEPRG